MQERNRILTILGALVLVAALSFGGGVLGARLARTANAAETRSGVQFAPSVHTTSGDPTTGYERIPVVNTGTTLATASQAEIARSFQQQFRTVASQTLPVVVEVAVVNKVTQRVQGSPFDFFFGDPNDSEQEEREFRQEGMGSGVIVARDAETVYVLTNQHVVGKADEIELILHDDRSFEGTLIGSDELMDLALVSFETQEEVPIAPLADSDTLHPGDWVFAVGNPFGFQSTITAGIVSATARTAQAGSGMSGVTDYIQTDAAINRGNSGGPLVNLDGEVVGINTWIASQTGGSVGLGFAIPINNAKRAISDFLRDGEVAYSWLGVQVGTLGETLAEELGIERASGAFVSGVYEDSPADESGILPGDVIVKIGDTAIDSSNTLVRTVANMEPGAEVPFEIFRDETRITIDVRTGKRTAESGTEAPVWPGISVTPLNKELREQLDLSGTVNGVVVAGVAANSPASDSGLSAGDTITAVNGARVASLTDFYREINDVSGDEVQFRVIRDGRRIILGFVRAAA